MTEATRYTITVGNNTSVTGTSYKLDDAQLKQLDALVKSGDISLDKTTGVITAKTSHGLVVAGAIVGVPIDEMMEVDGLPGEINRGMTHESTMAAINRFSPSDPKEMSLSELMTCMMMMVYQSESERREALQTAKGSQLLIQMDQARMAWGQSREAAEKEFSNALMTSIGKICSGVVSAGMGIAGGIVQSRVNHYNKMATKAEDCITKADLAKQHEIAKNEADKIDKDFNSRVEAKAKENANKIRDNENKVKDAESNDEKNALEKDNKALEADNNYLGYDANGDINESFVPDYEKSSLRKQYADKQTADKKVADIEAKIVKMGGVVDGETGITDKNDKNGVQWGKTIDDNGKMIDVDKEAFVRKAEKYREKASSLRTKANMLQSAGVIGQVAAGGFQIGAAYAAKDAAFLRAEAQLTDAFRNFSGQLVSNIDQSAEQALRQMSTLISSLKEVFRAAYDIECSIARNI